MMKGSISARRCVERRDTERSLAVKVVNKAGIYLSPQSAHIPYTATNEFTTGFVDQRLHFFGPLFLIGAPDIYESSLSELAGVVVLALSGRDTVLILVTVLVTEDSHIDIAAFYFFQVNLIRSSVLGRKVLKEEDFRDEAMEDGITQKESLQVRANLLELILNTTDEYS